MILKIDHIGIAVNSIEDAIKFYSNVFGLEAEEVKTSETQKIKVAMVRAGENRIELLEPTDCSSVIAKYIEKRGEGMHHLALEVSNIEDTLKTLKEKGVPLIDAEPRSGVGGTRIAFLHHKGTQRVLIESCEKCQPDAGL